MQNKKYNWASIKVMLGGKEIDVRPMNYIDDLNIYYILENKVPKKVNSIEWA